MIRGADATLFPVHFGRNLEAALQKHEQICRFSVESARFAPVPTNTRARPHRFGGDGKGLPKACSAANVAAWPRPTIRDSVPPSQQGTAVLNRRQFSALALSLAAAPRFAQAQAA